MQILNSNTGEKTVGVIKNHVFVYVTDYGMRAILKEIIVSFGQHHWDWIIFDANKPIDITDIGNRFSTFDNALNRAVNDSYCTIYELADFDELMREWDSVKYIDNIKTVYKSKGYEQEVPDDA